MVAVISALVLFVFAKFSHRQRELKRRSRIDNDEILHEDKVSSLVVCSISEIQMSGKFTFTMNWEI